MKILVISTNIVTKPAPVVPVGAGMIYNCMKDSGYEVSFLDLAFLEDPIEALKGELQHLSPDVICLSIRNIDNQVFQKPDSFMPFLKNVAATCHAWSDGWIILGGAAMQVMPLEVIEFLEGDFGISGYDETQILELLQEIENHNTNETDKIYAAGNAFHPVYSRLPQKDLFKDRYFLYNTPLKKAVMGYQTSRGCINTCIYCSMGCKKQKFTRISPGQFDADMELLAAQYQINNITLVDDVFNQDIETSIEICEKLIQGARGIRWGCSMSPSVISEELVAYIKEAGCIFVDLGIDSACDSMLKRMGKGFWVEDLILLAKLLEKYEIPYSASLLFGGPGENEVTVKETIENVNRLNPVYVLASLGIRIYPGTSLHEIALREGVIQEKENLLEPKFYQSQTFSGEVLKRALGNSVHGYKDMLMNTF